MAYYLALSKRPSRLRLESIRPMAATWSADFMGEYVLLYRNSVEGSEEALGTPERAQASIARCREWIDGLAANGQLRNVGLALQPPGRVVRGARKTVIDGPFAETKELVVGFSVIEARDFVHAAEIAAGWPMLERGGSVEVRPVLALPD
jgi:hypothetical protein